MDDCERIETTTKALKDALTNSSSMEEVFHIWATLGLEHHNMFIELGLKAKEQMPSLFPDDLMKHMINARLGIEMVFKYGSYDQKVRYATTLTEEFAGYCQMAEMVRRLTT